MCFLLLAEEQAPGHSRLRYRLLHSGVPRLCCPRGGDLPRSRPAGWTSGAFAMVLSDHVSESIILDCPGGQFTVVTAHAVPG